MKLALDFLVMNYPGFVWLANSLMREFDGKLRRDGSLRVKIRCVADGWEASGWEARAHVDGSPVTLTSGVYESPCEAMADLLVRCMCRVLACVNADAALEHERDALNVRVNELVAVNMELEGLRAEAVRWACSSQDKLEDAKRALDTLGAQFATVTNERDDLRTQLKAALACGKSADADAVSRVDAAEHRAVFFAAEARRLRPALAQETTRAERWQECAADLLAQVAQLRAKVWRLSQMLDGEEAEPSLAQDIAESMREVRHG
jgi:hypothetical protein